MNKNKLIIISFVFILILFIIAISSPSTVETRGYILTPSEYTITRVVSYRGKQGRRRRYQIDITHDKDGKTFKSHCYTSIDKDEYNIIKNYFDNGNQEAAKNYIGNIKAYRSNDFIILNPEIND